MRVLIIVPTVAYSLQYPAFVSMVAFPAGLAYLASAVRKAGFEVFGLNPNNAPGYDSAAQMVRQRLDAALRDIQPDVVCTGGLCGDYAFLRDVIRITRETAPNVPIILGGGIISYDTEFIFQQLRPDFCVVGEGEEVLVSLLTTLRSGERQYGGIPNLGYWEAGVARFTQRNFHYGDLNQRAFPNYDIFGGRELMVDYPADPYLFRFVRPKPRAMVIVTGRSCPFRCTFCVHENIIPYRARSIENVLQEIGFLYEKYEFNILACQDELFAANRQRLREFSEGVLHGRATKGWDFHWMFQTHASARLDHETLTLAREAGCYHFSYGLESASPRVLGSMNKRVKPEQIAEATDLASRTRVGFGGNFIFGDVAETPETVHETMEFFRRHCDGMHIQLAHIHPYPGSKLFLHCLEKGLIPNRETFYATINQKAHNMTGMASWVWLPWLAMLWFLSELRLSYRLTGATSCKVAANNATNPVSQHMGLTLVDIAARCPYCGEAVEFQEFIGSPPTKQVNPYSVVAIVVRTLGYLRSKRWFIGLLFVGMRFGSLFQSLWGDLLVLRRGGPLVIPWVFTACSHCRKPFRIGLGKDIVPAKRAA